jgi:hypothetical protein
MIIKIIKILMFTSIPFGISCEIINVEDVEEIEKIIFNNKSNLIICDTKIFFNTPFYKKKEEKNKQEVKEKKLQQQEKQITLKKSDYKDKILNFFKKHENFYLIHTGISLNDNISNLCLNGNNITYLLIKKGKNNPFIMDKIIVDNFIRHEVLIYFLILNKKINMKNKKIIYITYSKQVFKTIHNEDIIWVLMKNNKKKENKNQLEKL